MLTTSVVAGASQLNVSLGIQWVIWSLRTVSSSRKVPLRSWVMKDEAGMCPGWRRTQVLYAGLRHPISCSTVTACISQVSELGYSSAWGAWGLFWRASEVEEVTVSVWSGIPTPLPSSTIAALLIFILYIGLWVKLYWEKETITTRQYHCAFKP